jgi:hypothetical protein
MTQTACEIPIAASEAPRPAGFLLAPFGWATARVTAMLQHEPALLADVIHISHTRMHLIALAIAHLDDATPQGIGETLFRGSAGEILDAVVDRRPVGLKRAVRSLPDRVLQAESYRRLLVLLGDPKAAKLLHHSAEIDDATIKMTDDIPPPLRSLVFSMQPWFRGI